MDSDTLLLLAIVAILSLVLYTIGHYSRQRSLHGKCVLITGAAGAVGRALTHQLAVAAVSRLVLWDIDAHALAALQRDLLSGPYPELEIRTATVDVSSGPAVAAAAAAMSSAGWDVDVLVSNAAVVMGQRVEDLSSTALHTSMSVNLLAPFHLLRGFLPSMKRRGGCSVVLVSSLMARFGAARLADYAAAKAALVSLGESLRMELQVEGCGSGAGGVSVQVVCPHHIRGPLFGGAMESSRTVWDRLRAFIYPPLTPQQVAAAIVADICTGGDKITTLPASLGWAVWLLRCPLLPLWFQDAAVGRLGGWEGMDGWKGASRNK